MTCRKEIPETNSRYSDLYINAFDASCKTQNGRKRKEWKSIMWNWYSKCDKRILETSLRLCDFLSIAAVWVQNNFFYKMNDYDSRHYHLPFYSFLTYSSLCCEKIVCDQLLTKYMRNKCLFSVNRNFVLAGRCRLITPAEPDHGDGFTTKETKRTTTIHPLFPRVKQMFNQSSYRFQKSQCDKCSWKRPANRVMSDWTRPRFRKQRKMASITKGCWFYQSHGDISKPKKKEREEFPILSVNSPSLCQRLCLYLLLHINYSIDAGSGKDKLILFTARDQSIHLKIRICK